jgi:tetratricopeptide (TPR) repeat protein
VTSEERLEQAYDLYVDAVFSGIPDATERAHGLLDGVEADLSLARGRLRHAEFLRHRETEDPRELTDFERAAELYADRGDARGEGEALFWLGTVHQVVRGDVDTARPYFERSYKLAGQVGDKLTMSYAVRHLGFVDMDAGRLDEARAKLEESVALRREVGFAPGVAAGLLALAQLAHERGDDDEARAQMDEAEAVAKTCGANGILAWIEEARSELAPP